MAAPRSPHYAAVLRILRYLKGTIFDGLHFSSHSSLTLQAYSDADWACDPTNRRSTTGYCFMLGDSLISWRSKKQTVVARSSTEAEYRALAATTAELIWLRWLLQDLGIDCSAATQLHCDNQSAIQIAHNDVFHDVLSILRSIVTSSTNMCFRVQSHFSRFPLRTSLLISSPNLFLQDPSVL